MVCLKNRTFLLLVFCTVATVARSQIKPERCGTVTYEKIRRQNHPNLENSERFEQWMRDRVSRIKKTNLIGGRTQDVTYTIPVVVHVIHNGEAVGVGSNISDAQIQAQIDVINRDFKRLNPDTLNTPAEFKPVAGGIDMEFVLAKQDPEGLATNGIVRVQSNQNSWTMAEGGALKALSYWPAENYLNIWVTRLVDPDGVIGYAQLPVSDLPGLEDSSTDRLTDGVVIQYSVFGDNLTSAAPYDKGRTATHEIGHIFGLRHIWGDGGLCNSTDYCNDTPIQDASTTTCPSTPQSVCSPSHHKMFQNFMDYTDDACMNLYTQDQVARMIVVLQNSPRRASLLVSPGATQPVSVPDDLGIKRINSPRPLSCRSVTPAIEVRNYGSNPVTSAQIQLSVDGDMVETKDFVLSLGTLDSTEVAFNPLTLPFASTSQFEFVILSTNEVVDGKALNDTLRLAVKVPALTSLPLLEQFNVTPVNWTIANPDGQVTWTNTLAPNDNPSNKGMYMNFYNYESVGEEDRLISPIFDLSTDTAALLRFDRAYAPINSSYNDRLRVVATIGCDYAHPIELFNKSANSGLATSTNSSSEFHPNSSADWQTETLSLLSFLGEPNVQIMFIATNDYGNNLYVDNVRIIVGNYTDVVLSAIKRPSPVTCERNPTPLVTVKNNGSTIVTEMVITSTVNDVPVGNVMVSGLHLDTGEEVDVPLNPWSLNPGANTASVMVDSPNEIAPADNTINLNEVVNTSRDIIPFRQDFEGNYDDWTIVSETNQAKWISVKTNKSRSLEYSSFSNSDIGNQSWLVSPTLDFSRTQKAGLFFDVSYALSTTGNERLQVVLSSDCGQTFPNIIFDQTGDMFDKGSSTTEWLPTQDDDWRRLFVNLDTLAGESDARIGFVVTNDHGNNLYIDNIEVFIDDEENPIAINTLYAVYDNLNPIFKVTFNLSVREPVRMQIVNMIGQVVLDNTLPDVLNQTYDVDLSGQQTGIYIVRLQMGSVVGTARVYVP